MRKSVLTGTETSVHLSMPISKVDEEKRLVSGFATLDNVDSQGDRVVSNASVEAFQKFRGNIREMHAEHLAAGRLVNFQEQMYFDEESNKFLTGVYVTAYVSKGAQNTWEKVLDGTLSGFSIGGGVDEYINEVDENGNPIRVITKYHLTELSLVDNPANQMANVMSIQKSASGTATLEGIAADVETKTIFFCPTDKKALLAKGEEHGCPECGNQMESIGWCESSGTDVIDDMKAAVEKRLSENREGGAVSDMTVEKNTAVETAEVEAPVVETTDEVTETPDVENTEEVEAAEDTVEVEEDSTEDAEEGEDLSQVIAEFQARVLDAIKDGHAEQGEKVDELRKELGGIEEQFVAKLSSLEKTVEKLENDQAELGKSFKGIQDSVSEVEKGLREVDPATALKKSVDIDQSAETVSSAPKSVWGGAFLNVDSL